MSRVTCVNHRLCVDRLRWTPQVHRYRTSPCILLTLNVAELVEVYLGLPGLHDALDDAYHRHTRGGDVTDSAHHAGYHAAYHADVDATTGRYTAAYHAYAAAFVRNVRADTASSRLPVHVLIDADPQSMWTRDGAIRCPIPWRGAALAPRLFTAGIAGLPAPVPTNATS